MKCLSCNNEIPDASVMCPFCHKSVEPVATAQPIFNVSSNNDNLPVTPTEPVLPQDQGMTSKVIAPAEPIIESITLETQSIPIVDPKTGEQISSNGDEKKNDTPDLADLNEKESKQSGASYEVVGGNDVLSVPENGIEPSYINASGEVVDGQKISNALPVQEKKKINNKKFITIIIIVLVVALFSGIGIYFYISQFTTANKRVNSVINGIISPIVYMGNDKINKQTGTYKVDLEINYDKNSLKSKFDGTYGKDLENEVLDLTLNLKSLILEEEMIDNPINLEFYYNDSKMYVLFQNFYSNYIYDEYHDLDEIFKSIEKNKINYSTILSGLNSGFISGVNSIPKSQSIGKVTIDGTTKNANIVKMNLDDFNVSNFYNSFFMSIQNNQMFIDETAKLLNIKSEDLVASIEEIKKNIKGEKTNIVVEIYTGILKNELYGIKIINNEKVLEIFPFESGYKMTYKDGTQSLFEGSYTKSYNKTSITNETTYKYEFTVYIDKTAYTGNIILENTEDINPKDSKVYVKNSINKKYITEADRQAIIDASSKAGKIGLYLPQIISLYLPSNGDIVNPNLVNGREVSSEDICLAAINCSPFVDGYNICHKLDTQEEIVCKIN